MAGRPKNTYTDEEIQQMSEYALNGCQNNTIATLMNIPNSSLIRHFGNLLTKKRAERKYNIRAAQNKAIEQGNPALLIFLGKNELDQVDKQEIKQETTEVAALTAEQEVQAQVMAEVALRHGAEIRAEIERRGKVKLKGA